ncbi:uncharacterized protein DUF4199 [Kordia periserrulae]|uniref:Uncharacterized protein DUF4199 n=1 Tax=Kordia periserrulae TaxID=701523 RepID=A0A2T6BT60_9FLAO|nr:DUF4199 domain-containing protein [Kordia periserrulae]PTX59252.1 uncharacterized protein DUF4199 [Kordia periserrulae]
MNKLVRIYGIYGFIIAVILFSTVLYFGNALAFKTHGIIGYLTMIASVSVSFYGIKHFVKLHQDKEISFKEILGIGILISLFPAIAFGIIDAIYISVIHPEFPAEFITYKYAMLDSQTHLVGEELRLAKLAVLKQSEAFKNPILVFFVSMMMVFVIGVIVSLISTLIVHKKQP